MKFLLVLCFVMGSASSFAQVDRSEYNYNRCIDGWKAFDGGLNENRQNACTYLGFAQCFANHMDIDRRINQDRIDGCLAIPDPELGVKETCQQAWLIFDGSLGDARSARCQEPAFAQCMNNYIRADGIMTAARTRVCGGLSN